MKDRFAKHLAESGMITPGATVILGYSGGADSTCLLSLLSAERVDVIACHLHHGMRTEADEEERMCKKLCDSLGVPFMAGRADVPRLARDAKVGIEEAGRNARYAFFEQCKSSSGAHLIATAHTMDDLAETVILNLTRGSGMKGLVGIPEQTDGLVRPLLPFTREETRAYCGEHQLWFHDDPANDDLNLSRVAVRKKVMPVLQSVNSAALQNIARCARTLDEEDKFLDGMAAAALDRAEYKSDSALAFLVADVEVVMHRERIADIPRALLARSLRLVTGYLGSALDYHQTHAVIDELATESGKGSVTSEGGSVVTEWNDEWVVCRSLAKDAVARVPLVVPGSTVSERAGWVILSEESDGKDYMREPGSLDVVASLQRMKPPFHVRSYEEADEVTMLGSDHPRKLHDVLVSAGLGASLRSRLPIVFDMVGPVWLPGVAIADRAKVTGSWEQCIRLRLEPHDA